MKTWPVCALEIGIVKITAIVGELQADGNISIMGKGEYALGSSELGKAPVESPLKEALAIAEESAEACINTVHIVMPCENIISLISQGSIPVLTSINDPEIEKQIAQLEGIKCNVTDVVFSGYCAALAVTTPKQKEKGVVVFDVGSEIVSFAAFLQGKLVAVDAFKIKSKVDSETIRTIHKSLTGAVILKSIADGILLTGEGAQAQVFSNLAETTFGMKCAFGFPVGFKGLDAALNRPEYAACLGMLRYAYTDGLSKVTRSSRVVEIMRQVFRL